MHFEAIWSIYNVTRKFKIIKNYIIPIFIHSIENIISFGQGFATPGHVVTRGICYKID